jgi:hypothetical protein
MLTTGRDRRLRSGHFSTTSDRFFFGREPSVGSLVDPSHLGSHSAGVSWYQSPEMASFHEQTTQGYLWGYLDKSKSNTT